MSQVRIQHDDFSVQEETDAIRQMSKRIGGVVSFLGCARDFSDGREILSIAFEQYEAMALESMRQLRDEAMRVFDIIEVRVIHRVATVQPGDQIVLIVVGAEHRAPAFGACQWIIDELKQRVPIWKKEATRDGELWVSSHP